LWTSRLIVCDYIVTYCYNRALGGWICGPGCAGLWMASKLLRCILGHHLDARKQPWGAIGGGAQLTASMNFCHDYQLLCLQRRRITLSAKVFCRLWALGWIEFNTPPSPTHRPSFSSWQNIAA
jgi:hypothetical protein